MGSMFRDSQAGIFLSRGVLATAKIKDKVVSIMVLILDGNYEHVAHA